MKVSRRYLVAVMGAACAVPVGCGGGSSSPKTNPPPIAQSGSNVAALTVNAGPAGNYANGAFASVTVCVPNSATCQTIDGVLVDTGSFGLRVLSSALTLSLPQQKETDGNAVAECQQFLGSYTWGPVQTADIEIGGEKASSLAIQVLSDTDFAVPSSCPNGLPSADTLSALGANGILGVGIITQDCGGYCVQAMSSVTTPPDVYYECSSPTAVCQPAWQSLSLQVTNPVSLFASDNNGVIIELPAVSGAETSISGSLVFGIGTQTNNALGSATIYTTDPNGYFTATYKNTPYAGSFLDSGSNGYYFLNSGLTGLPVCTSATGFYCPSSTETITTTNSRNTSGSGTVSFMVANAESLFANAGDAVFGDLGGPSSGPTIGANYFDYGLPFFYGRNVYTAIEGSSTPGGAGPFYAY